MSSGQMSKGGNLILKFCSVDGAASTCFLKTVKALKQDLSLRILQNSRESNFVGVHFYEIANLGEFCKHFQKRCQEE